MYTCKAYHMEINRLRSGEAHFSLYDCASLALSLRSPTSKQRPNAWRYDKRTKSVNALHDGMIQSVAAWLLQGGRSRVAETKFYQKELSEAKYFESRVTFYSAQSEDIIKLLRPRMTFHIHLHYTQNLSIVLTMFKPLLLYC